jgi:hypothetical protein
MAYVVLRAIHRPNQRNPPSTAPTRRSWTTTGDQNAIVSTAARFDSIHQATIAAK